MGARGAALWIRSLGGRVVKMHDAGIEPMTNFETAMREYFQHLAVVAEHSGFELGDAALARDECEMFEQDRADALALVFIENRECNFRATRIFSAQIAADSDEAFASVLSEGRGETDVIVEIEFGELLQIQR